MAIMGQDSSLSEQLSKHMQDQLDRLYEIYKNNANKHKIIFDIDINYFKKIISLNCHYCGNKPKIGAYNKLGRLDINNGYTSDNIIIICNYCEAGRGDRTSIEFRDWVIKLYHNISNKSTITRCTCTISDICPLGKLSATGCTIDDLEKSAVRRSRQAIEYARNELNKMAGIKSIHRNQP